jgi:DNA-binding CsgD family transcriptional regulator
MDTQAGNYITGDTAFAVDRRGAIVLWNEAAEKTLGYSSSDALGQKCWKLLFGDDTNGNRYCCRHCPIRKMAFHHEPVNSFLSTFRTASDQPRQFSVSCITVPDEHDSEMLLHVCRPENNSGETGNEQARARTPAGNHPGTLSHRELEVLALLADKMSTRDIAATLSISIRTVRTHIQHLMYKLQVHKRCEAVETGKHLKLI